MYLNWSKKIADSTYKKAWKLKIAHCFIIVFFIISQICLRATTLIDFWLPNKESYFVRGTWVREILSTRSDVMKFLIFRKIRNPVKLKPLLQFQPNSKTELFRSYLQL